MWGSALTDHAVKENRVIDWERAKIVEKEREDLARGDIHPQIAKLEQR